MKANKKALLPPDDPIDAFVKAAQDGPEAIMLLLWKMRFDNPSFSVEIHPKDLKGFYECVEYLKVQPKIQVLRPGGVPAVEGTPAVGNRRATPPRAAIPPKNYAVIQMVDEKGDTFVPIENNQVDFDEQARANKVRQAKDQAGSVVTALRNDIGSGQFSTGNINDAIAILTVLSTQ